MSAALLVGTTPLAKSKAVLRACKSETGRNPSTGSEYALLHAENTQARNTNPWILTFVSDMLSLLFYSFPANVFQPACPKRVASARVQL